MPHAGIPPAQRLPFSSNAIVTDHAGIPLSLLDEPQLRNAARPENGVSAVSGRSPKRELTHKKPLPLPYQLSVAFPSILPLPVRVKPIDAKSPWNASKPSIGPATDPTMICVRSI